MSTVRSDVPTPAEPDVDRLVVPDYGGACVTNLMPSLLEVPEMGRDWIPTAALDAEQVVVLVIDGLGWLQLARRHALAPVLAGATGQAITTVAPTTTAAALTSIVTGASPGEHGVVGYRIRVSGETLNALRWTTQRGDARASLPPSEMQPLPPFMGRDVVVVNKAEFAGSGFTQAHLDPVDYRPYGTIATMVHEVAVAAAQGARLIYTYYDGLDRVGHERGHGEAFDAEFAFVDRLVGDVRAALPSDTALLVTSDHGQVDTTNGVRKIDAELAARCVAISGEDRFSWLHAPGDQDSVAAMARDRHGAHAWVYTVDEVIEMGLLGHVGADARARLGDVALLARGDAALLDPNRQAPQLFGRHGSLTPEEVYVPLLSI